MIQVMIFDLDGTLVQTEKLKARSYARAAVELCPYDVEEHEVIDAYREVVGLSRRKVARRLVERFDLAEKALERKDEFGVETAWQAYVQVRLKFYHRMIEDPEVIRDHRWPHTMEVLEQARQQNCRVALATMSRCEQARRVLTALGLEDAFDFVATRDDVDHGKPDPEIYHLVARELEVDPASCLVIEDSPTGVEAALHAGMRVVAVSTPFTREHLREGGLLPLEHIVDDPEETGAVLAHVIQHLEGAGG